MFLWCSADAFSSCFMCLQKHWKEGLKVRDLGLKREKGMWWIWVKKVTSCKPAARLLSFIWVIYPQSKHRTGMDLAIQSFVCMVLPRYNPSVWTSAQPVFPIWIICKEEILPCVSGEALAQVPREAAAAPWGLEISFGFWGKSTLSGNNHRAPGEESWIFQDSLGKAAINSEEPVRPEGQRELFEGVSGREKPMGKKTRDQSRGIHRIQNNSCCLLHIPFVSSYLPAGRHRIRRKNNFGAFWITFFDKISWGMWGTESWVSGRKKKKSNVKQLECCQGNGENPSFPQSHW